MKVAVLVSGGVDSSVALAALAANPHLELTAFYLKIWLEDELAFLGECPWEEDLRHVESVTSQLGVPLEVIPLQRAYHQRVVAHALDELARGRTPSPDLHCNAQIKFGAFVDALEAYEGENRHFDYIATGHYAQVIHAPGRPSRLLRAADAKKDQTYFLSRLSQSQLSRALFPIAALPKPEVRAQAKKLGLATAERKDSQGICFLGKIPYPEFVREHLGSAPGDIADIDSGNTLGQHQGLWFHTIGQRKGLGLPGGPWYVVDKDIPGNRLLVAHANQFEAYHTRRFEVDGLHWFDQAPPLDETIHVKLRHGPRLLEAKVYPGRHSQCLEVELSEPDQGIAPGQFTVFYRNQDCLGSAIIAGKVR